MVAARAADVSAKVRSTDVSAAAASLIKAASPPDVEATDLLCVCPHASDETLSARKRVKGGTEACGGLLAI